ncbi:hypothetical protein GF360_02255 [candidate division WWE3 bacterium]|nr:hypothetical protein [candidate division WWE3 bacterium]
MNLLQRLKAKPQLLLFALFFAFHLLLLNVNYVEWGDSYRILRASEYIRDFSYPLDEKRPPLYSALLALRPLKDLDPVFWGKVFMLAVSALCFYVFYLVSREIFKKHANSKKLTLISLLFFAFNPVFFYWSLRIYADAFFALLVLLALLVYLKDKELTHFKTFFFLALLSALGILTRFEGYLLVLSLGLTFLLKGFQRIDYTSLQTLTISKLWDVIRKPLTYGLLTTLLILPYWIWRNPLASSYFEEPSGRSYDLVMLARYILSLAFLFGFTPAFAFFAGSYKKAAHFFKENLFVFIFTFLELLLVLAWPAAVPRLFIPVIPLLIWPLSISVSAYFRSLNETPSNNHFSRMTLPLFSLGLTALYILGQRFITLQFLIPSFKLVLVVALINLLALWPLYKKSLVPFMALTALSIILWSAGVIYAHRNIYSTIRQGLDYLTNPANDVYGRVAYNDSSSVSDWYLNENPTIFSQALEGTYFEYGSSEQLSLSNLQEKGYDYLLFTNEHNPALDVDFDKRPYLKTLATFEKEINGKMFFTKVIEVMEPSTE